MDPYLEGELWQEFHQTLATEIRRQLNPLLRPKYVALLEKYYAPDNAIPQMRVIIRDVAQRRLVTLIEILSPVNKTGDGAFVYHKKRLDIFESTTHLMEIDLLRAGMRPAAGEPLPDGDYYVLLSRATMRDKIAVWAMHLPDRLPVVPVPLLDPDPDVLLDVQAALNASFDVVGYDLLIDYTAPPPPPDLPPEGVAWVDALLKTGGRRAESV
jgi:hypothetical protein